MRVDKTLNVSLCTTRLQQKVFVDCSDTYDNDTMHVQKRRWTIGCLSDLLKLDFTLITSSVVIIARRCIKIRSFLYFGPL